MRRRTQSNRMRRMTDQAVIDIFSFVIESDVNRHGCFTLSKYAERLPRVHQSIWSAQAQAATRLLLLLLLLNELSFVHGHERKAKVSVE